MAMVQELPQLLLLQHQNPDTSLTPHLQWCYHDSNLNSRCKCYQLLISIMSIICYLRKNAWCVILCISSCMKGYYPSSVSILRQARFHVNSFLPLLNLDCWACIWKAMAAPG